MYHGAQLDAGRVLHRHGAAVHGAQLRGLFLLREGRPERPESGEQRLSAWIQSEIGGNILISCLLRYTEPLGANVVDFEVE